MMKRTGGMFAMLGRTTCSFEQHAAIVARQGWTKGLRGSRSLGELRSRPTFEGVPDARTLLKRYR